MSITDELREWVAGAKPAVVDGCSISVGTMTYGCKKALLAIADRIDAEHEAALLNVHTDLMDASGWVRLPSDADGEPWHIGDRTESGQTIEAMGLNKHGWHFVGTVNEIDPAIHRHYHAPTVEDVLREFASDIADVLGGDDFRLDDSDELFAEYAAKLRLAGGEDA